MQKEVKKLKEQQETAQQNFEKDLQEKWLGWADDYKKQQSANLTKTEIDIRNRCRKERDAQVEKAIDIVEKKTREIENTLRERTEKTIE